LKHACHNQTIYNTLVWRSQVINFLQNLFFLQHVQISVPLPPKQKAILLRFLHHFKHNSLPFCLSCQHIIQFVPLLENCNPLRNFQRLKWYGGTKIPSCWKYSLTICWSNQELFMNWNKNEKYFSAAPLDFFRKIGGQVGIFKVA